MNKQYRAWSGPDGQHQSFRDAEDAVEWMKTRSEKHGYDGSLKKRDYDSSLDDTRYMIAAWLENGVVSRTRKFHFVDNRTETIVAVKTGETQKEAISRFFEEGDHHMFFGDADSDLTVRDKGFLI